MLYFIFLYQSLSSSLWMVFHAISSKIDEVLPIKPSANMFVFGHFTVHPNDCLIFSRGTYRPGDFCFNVLISNEFIEMVNIPTWIADHGCNSKWLSLCLEILIMLLSQFPLTFCQTQKEMSCVIGKLMSIFVLIERVFMIISEMMHWRIVVQKMYVILFPKNWIKKLKKFAKICTVLWHSTISRQ